MSDWKASTTNQKMYSDMYRKPILPKTFIIGKTKTYTEPKASITSFSDFAIVVDVKCFVDVGLFDSVDGINVLNPKQTYNLPNLLIYLESYPDMYERA